MANDAGERPIWGFPQYIAVCFCLAGYGIVWTLPIEIIKSSPQYFILYHFTIIIIGIPFFYVALRLGSSSGHGIVKLFAENIPILRGIGIACVLKLFISTLYMQVRGAYFLYYCYSAIKDSLPFRWSQMHGGTNSNPYKTLETQYYFSHVLQVSDGIDQPGPALRHLASCLFLAWLVVFMFTLGGLRLFGWLMLPASIAKFALCVALMTAGWRDEYSNIQGIEKSVNPFYTTNTTALGTLGGSVHDFAEKWIPGVHDAITWSILWKGILPTMGKCLGKKTGINFHISWLTLLVMLTVLPHLFVNMVGPYIIAGAHHLRINVKDVTILGNLPFEAFPLIISTLQLGKGSAFLVFLTGFLSVVQLQGLFTIVILDNLFEMFRPAGKKIVRSSRLSALIASGVYCIIGLLLGIPMITKGGYYILLLIEKWIDKWLMFLIIIALIAYVYTFVRQEYRLVEKVVISIWFVIAGLLTAGLMGYNAHFPNDAASGYTYKEHVNGYDYLYPRWAYGMGWFVALGPLVLGLIIGFIVSCVIERRRTKRICHECAVMCCLVTDGFSDEVHVDYEMHSSKKRGISNHQYQRSNQTLKSTNTMETNVNSIHGSPMEENADIQPNEYMLENGDAYKSSGVSQQVEEYAY